MFRGCSSLESIPDISKWNSNNIINMSSIFRGYIILFEIPNLSKWTTD